MFGIMNAAFRVATLSDSSREPQSAPTQRANRPQTTWFDDTPRDPRTGLRLGKSWADRD